MCEAVASALDQDRHLVVAAGTGTGKSMAYLAPLVTSGKKAVVATATKALQDQLVNKDLPQLARALGMPLNYAVLKGRSNYICRKKLADLAAVAGSEQGQLIAADSALEAGRIRKELEQLAAWAEQTPDGDEAGLDFKPSAQAWEAVSVSGRECPGAANCPSGSDCFAEQARNKAADVDVLVVNTHLYCLHAFTDAEVLPAHDAVVFDEAQTVEDIAAAAAGVSVTGGRFKAAARTVKAAVPRSRTADDLDAAGESLRSALRPYRDQRLAPVPDELVDLAVLCRGRLDAANAEVRDAPGDGTRRAMARRSLAALAEDLVQASNPETEDAVWVEGPERNPAWRTAPIDVSAPLQERLWTHTPAVLTSATIPANLVETLALTIYKGTVIAEVVVNASLHGCLEIGMDAWKQAPHGMFHSFAAGPTRHSDVNIGDFAWPYIAAHAPLKLAAHAVTVEVRADFYARLDANVWDVASFKENDINQAIWGDPNPGTKIIFDDHT